MDIFSEQALFWQKNPADIPSHRNTFGLLLIRGFPKIVVPFRGPLEGDSIPHIRGLQRATPIWGNTHLEGHGTYEPMTTVLTTILGHLRGLQSILLCTPGNKDVAQAMQVKKPVLQLLGLLKLVCLGFRA